MRQVRLLLLSICISLGIAFQPVGHKYHHRSVVQSATTLRVSQQDAANAAYNLPPIPPNAKRLFLIRHGEVVNPGGTRKVFYGDMNVPLTLLGQQEACAAADYLKDHATLEAVYCSPLSRAYYGAQQVGSRQAAFLEPIRLDGFKELNRGLWRGQTKEEIGEDLLARFNACDPQATPASGESFPELKARVSEAHRTVLDSLHYGQAAAIVSHLQVTRCIVADALDIPIEEMTTIDIDTASVTCIDYVYHVLPQQTIRFQSFKPQAGLPSSDDGAN